ncbi:hypothetical protein MVEN_02020600 [Mycena venus]|uniref:Uncharacterized protein n=1 Tax=Mycena venus TaxID=2733690 RepID=A0A8H6XCJ2_9AGAR|nr:hypothetical protein MVEN_02020600 [Mycena venus]
MSLLLTPIIGVFNYTLQPIAPFTWFNVSLSTLDVVAAFRLCIVLRQIKDSPVSTACLEEWCGDCRTKGLCSGYIDYPDCCVMTAPLLCIPPSFMVSGVVPVFYAVVQALVEMLPAVPTMSIHTELPLSVVDGFTRALLLCNLIPPAVTANASPVIAASPWTLLVTSLVTANGGFFPHEPLLLPQPDAHRNPDAARAPAVRMDRDRPLPFWADLHTVLSGMFGTSAAVTKTGVVEALDPRHGARGNFAPEVWKGAAGPIKQKGEKLKTQ